MALQKNIELENGVITTYHRIVSLNKITNNSNIIEVASYTNQSKRNEEAIALENGEPMNVFIYSQFINKEYNKNESIEDAYNYLKTLDTFNGARDI